MAFSLGLLAACTVLAVTIKLWQSTKCLHTKPTAPVGEGEDNHLDKDATIISRPFGIGLNHGKDGPTAGGCTATLDPGSCPSKGLSSSEGLSLDLHELALELREVIRPSCSARYKYYIFSASRI
jgi:hypothetical protein